MSLYFDNNPNPKRESITIRRTWKGVWQKMFDDYETSFRRISKAEALESIAVARASGNMYCDADETKDSYLVFGYFN